MSKYYYMLFVKGVPKSTQIKWFVERYSKDKYKKDDLKHVEHYKIAIDIKEEYAGVYIRNDEYRYILIEDTLDRFKSYKEVFYCDNDIPLGEL